MPITDEPNMIDVQFKESIEKEAINLVQEIVDKIVNEDLLQEQLAETLKPHNDLIVDVSARSDTIEAHPISPVICLVETQSVTNQTLQLDSDSAIIDDPVTNTSEILLDIEPCKPTPAATVESVSEPPPANNYECKVAPTEYDIKVDEVAVACPQYAGQADEQALIGQIIPDVELVADTTIPKAILISTKPAMVALDLASCVPAVGVVNDVVIAKTILNVSDIAATITDQKHVSESPIQSELTVLGESSAVASVDTRTLVLPVVDDETSSTLEEPIETPTNSIGSLAVTMSANETESVTAENIVVKIQPDVIAVAAPTVTEAKAIPTDGSTTATNNETDIIAVVTTSVEFDTSSDIHVESIASEPIVVEAIPTNIADLDETVQSEPTSSTEANIIGQQSQPEVNISIPLVIVTESSEQLPVNITPVRTIVKQISLEIPVVDVRENFDDMMKPQVVVSVSEVLPTDSTVEAKSASSDIDSEFVFVSMPESTADQTSTVTVAVAKIIDSQPSAVKVAIVSDTEVVNYVDNKATVSIEDATLLIEDQIIETPTNTIDNQITSPAPINQSTPTDAPTTDLLTSTTPDIELAKPEGLYIGNLTVQISMNSSF